MVKRQKRGITKNATGKGFNEARQEASKIGASTIYGTRTERLSQFDGFLAVCGQF